ncbi:MAG TPA: porin [Beijerinckiaceae bacterium]|nr:porin [Beijerinckiaceae bacterium]
MKLVKSLLLAAPATILGAYAVQAADLPSREAAPIHYVRICDAYGSGFFFIPGTDTCLRVGGYVRAEFMYNPGENIINPRTGLVSQVAADQDTSGMEMRGRVDLDARTQTAWGTAQTVIWMRGTDAYGLKDGYSVAGAIHASGGPGYFSTGNGNPGPVFIERAFIRFAGITAGVGTENFVTLPPYMLAGFPWGAFPNGIKQLAYTATFGGGFSSTIAIENRGDYGYSNGPSQYTYNTRLDTGYNLVGNLRYDSSWGYIQVAGAIGNNSYANDYVGAPDSVTLTGLGLNNPLGGPVTQGAFAVGGSANFKLPMIAAGDQLHLNVAYGHGMLGLVGCGAASTCSDPTNRRMIGGVLRFDQNLIATHATGAVGGVTFGTVNSWAAGGIYTHYWSPTWRTNIAGGYQQIDEPTADVTVGEQLGNASLYEVGGNLIWAPTKNFNIGVEIDYVHLQQTLQNPTAAFVAAGQPGLSGNNWSGKLRLEREF